MLAFVGVSAGGAEVRIQHPGPEAEPADRMAKDVSATDKRLVFSNWPEYMDEDDKEYVSTLIQFEEDTGIKVHYTADVNDNYEFFAKVKNQLGTVHVDQRPLRADRLDGGPDDPGRLDPEARPRQGAQPARQHHRLAQAQTGIPTATTPRPGRAG